MILGRKSRPHRRPGSFGLGQIDSAIEEAANRGKTNTALAAIEGQRKARAALASERQREGAVFADLKAERAVLGAKGRQIEAEAAPIRYVAELIGGGTDSERAIRWLISLMVLCRWPSRFDCRGFGTKVKEQRRSFLHFCFLRQTDRHRRCMMTVENEPKETSVLWLAGTPLNPPRAHKADDPMPDIAA